MVYTDSTASLNWAHHVTWSTSTYQLYCPNFYNKLFFFQYTSNDLSLRIDFHPQNTTMNCLSNDCLIMMHKISSRGIIPICSDAGRGAMCPCWRQPRCSGSSVVIQAGLTPTHTYRTSSSTSVLSRLFSSPSSIPQNPPLSEIIVENT